MVARREQALSYAILLAFAVFAVYPFISTTLVAFNPPDATVHGLAIPQSWSLDSFVAAWSDPDASIGRSLLNSMILATVVVVVSVFLSILTGFAFGTMRFRGSSALFYCFLIGLIVPYEATIIPLYYEFRGLRLTDTYWAMILPDIGGSLAFGTFWMTSFFRGFPRELLDAARSRRRQPHADALAGDRPHRRSGDLRTRDDPVHLDLEQPAAGDRDDPQPTAADGARRPQLLRGSPVRHQLPGHQRRLPSSSRCRC